MFRHLFKLDLRSLALARILLGILALFDIGRRLDEIEVFFVDSGILSRADLIQNYELNWRMTLLNLNGSYSFALILALTGMAAALTFTVGWKTRISNLIIWIVTISFQARFPDAATSGGDMLIRIFYFFSLFLPMGAVYSFDSAVSEQKVENYNYTSIFTTLWTMQVFILYFFTFFYKWTPVYHTDFDAVWYMLQLEIFTTPFGKWLGQHYMLTKILSFTFYGLEILGPLMLLIPWKRDCFRGFAVLAFWIFHLGIGLTLHLGNFVPICLIIWVGLIPGVWWTYVESKLRMRPKYTLNLYYKSESLFARQLALIVKAFFFIDKMNIVPTNQDFINKGDLYLLEVFDEKQYYTGLDMAGNVLKNSSISLFRVLGKFLLTDLGHYLNEVKEVGGVNIPQDLQQKVPGDSLLLKISKNIFELLGFDRVKFRLNKFERYFGAFLLMLIISWNIEGYVKERKWYIGSPFDEIMFTLHFQQGWAMFAPHPQRSDGWWVMDGILKNGKKWDALNNKEVTFERPKDIYETFQSDDWRKFLDNLQGTRDNGALLALGRYLCRKWNTEHPKEESLQSFKLHFMQEWTNGPKGPPPKVEKLTLWNHSCF
jgi:hypothetical protein